MCRLGVCALIAGAAATLAGAIVIGSVALTVLAAPSFRPTSPALNTHATQILSAGDGLFHTDGLFYHERWGLLMRTGNDKSHFARQIERHADIYTSRISNFLAHSPFKYLRSSRGSLPHDPDAPDSGGAPGSGDARDEADRASES